MTLRGVALLAASKARIRRMRLRISILLFDLYRFGSEMNLKAKFASSLNELINEIRVKKGKRTRTNGVGL
jgi:hypothetical protein